MSDSEEPLELFVIVENPSDLPGVAFVVRRWVWDQPTMQCWCAPTIEAARKPLIARGLYRLPRQVGDEAGVVETWF